MCMLEGGMGCGISRASGHDEYVTVRCPFLYDRCLKHAYTLCTGIIRRYKYASQLRC